MGTDRAGKGAFAPCLLFSGDFLETARWVAKVALSLAELNNRIAILQDNIRQLVEQAAGLSGERNEERIAARIDQQNEELDKLDQRRDTRLKK